MEDNFLYIPQMLLIGSSGRNSGKTTLAIAFIQQWKNNFPIVGLKVTTIQERDGGCPRGGEGCGVCSSLKENFEILEETNQNANKDTSRILAAGAGKVYWLKTLKAHIHEGIKHFMTKIHGNTLIICESNSLGNVVRPGGFIMLKNTGSAQVKKSAREVIHRADIVIDYDLQNNMDAIIEKIKIDKIQSDLALKIKKC
jgi:hypothetical protein